MSDITAGAYANPYLDLEATVDDDGEDMDEDMQNELGEPVPSYDTVRLIYIAPR